MCGLAAILDWQAGGWPSEEAAVIAVGNALKAMRHRGHPEAQPKIVVDEKTVLGHIRLPIIDMHPRSDQPMTRSNVTGVFVGEIFNFQELGGTAFHSDTEYLLECFSARGLSWFPYFDGFWSAVLVGPIQGQVTVITDYLSQKPLYMHERSLLVVSEPNAAVAAISYLAHNPDPLYLSNVLKWGYDPTRRTPYAGLVQLPPGVALTIDQGVKATRYWDWQRVPDAPNLREALATATRNRLIGDRPVSLLLSGGLDSTILLGLLTQELGPQKVLALHAPNQEDGYLEEAITMHEPLSSVLELDKVTVEDALIAHQVPVDLGSMIPQTALARAVNEAGFFVCMSGDGADELFGGYRRAKEYDSQHSDTFMELVYYHLPRLDRIMMRSTVELRSPFLAPQVVKYALSLPWQARTEKQALKSTFLDLVPTEILNRPKHPLKSPEVINGGIEWRKTIIDRWEKLHVR